MQIEKYKLDEINQQSTAKHQRAFEFVAEDISNLNSVLQKLSVFNIAIPSWALGTGGTRFGRFSGGGEPRSLEEKICDVGVIHALNKYCLPACGLNPFSIALSVINIVLLLKVYSEVLVAVANDLTILASATALVTFNEFRPVCA